jgi:hypothetical protein
MEYTINPKCIKLLEELNFKLFRHQDLLCCVSRLGWSGHLCGYVAVDEHHPFFSKDYSDNVVVGNIEEVAFNGNYIGLLCHTFSDKPNNVLSLDLALNVHGGITYAKKKIAQIDENVFGNLWWFGFDTAHSGDAKPYLSEIDRKFPLHHEDEKYRDFNFTMEETKKLAEQLAKYNKL